MLRYMQEAELVGCWLKPMLNKHYGKLLKEACRHRGYAYGLQKAHQTPMKAENT
jgi:hypothetical protein